MTATFIERAAPAAEPAPRITVKVNGVTLTQRFAVTGLETLCERTNPAFALALDDAQNALCTAGARVTYLLDDEEIMWWTIKDIKPIVVDEGEELAQVVTYSGPTQALDGAVVYPSGGVTTWTEPWWMNGITISSKPYSDDRAMGWMERGYNDSAWGTPVEVGSPLGDNRPEGFIDPSAKWIWDAAPSGGSHTTNETKYFRHTFTPGTGIVFAVKIQLAARDHMQVYLDGTLIATTDPATDRDVATHAREIVVEINGDRPHVLAAAVTHLMPGPAGFLATIVQHKTATWVARTIASGWKCIDAAELESLTPGGAILQLIDEAQDRGWREDLEVSFDADEDTAGQPWPAILGDFVVRVIDSYDDVLDSLAEQYCEWGWSGWDELDMWVAEGLDLPGGGTSTGRGEVTDVEFEIGRNCTHLSHPESDEIVNSALTRWAEGVMEWSHDDSIDEWGRREGGLSLAAITHGRSVQRATEATLKRYVNPTASVVIEILPEDATEEPFKAFNVGDWVIAPNRFGDPVPYRVATIGFSEGSSEADAGQITWIVELGTPQEIQEARWERWLRRTANGTLDGRSRSMTPSSPSIMSAGLAQVVEIPFSTGGGQVLRIGDRGTPYRARQDLIVYRLTAETNVAGASGASTGQVYVNTTPGATITIPNTVDDSVADITPFFLPVNHQLNIECTAEGGHQGVTFTVLAVPAQ